MGAVERVPVTFDWIREQIDEMVCPKSEKASKLRDVEGFKDDGYSARWVAQRMGLIGGGADGEY